MTVAPGGDRSQALKDSVDAARQAEDLGYHRIWYAEHHDAASTASSAPEILIALAASATTRIRVGSGAVLLNHYSPYKVAENFLQLEALAPGRIDLGLGRATAGPVVDLALRRDRDVPPADDFAEQVQEVLAHFNGHFPANHPFARLNPAAGVASRPDVWILGSSGTSARMAGELGLGYAFAGFINPDGVPRALLRHGAFSAADRLAGGRGILSVSAVVADTDAEARRLNWSRTALMARLAPRRDRGPGSHGRGSRAGTQPGPEGHPHRHHRRPLAPPTRRQSADRTGSAGADDQGHRRRRSHGPGHHRGPRGPSALPCPAGPSPRRRRLLTAPSQRHGMWAGPTAGVQLWGVTTAQASFAAGGVPVPGAGPQIRISQDVQGRAGQCLDYGCEDLAGRFGGRGRGELGGRPGWLNGEPPP
ncbi:MsnO8 family LLM class oxidoreductase [Streptomyces caniscabiei]|uniref:MsnO8 family LLM class oxidoreductase n=1 Tax=Streptomyces caniscabiei TaxID=2746961 RepID=UPI0038F736C5